MADGSVDVLVCEEYKSSLNDSQASLDQNVNDNNESTTNENDTIHELLNNLSNFTVKRILRNDVTQKLLAVEGTFKGYKQPALVVLEKKGFPKEELSVNEAFFNDETIVKKIYRNDIYRGYDLFPEKEHNGLAATIIYPATPKHIEKFTPPTFYLVEETPEVYENVTLPIINSQQLSLQWVDNILEGKAETDRVIFNDPDKKTGFVLVKDLKMKDEKSLYLIALVRQKIKSIRDLNESHLPLLTNIKEAGTKAIKETYNISENQLKIFFHYQPSYYQLHVHFITLDVENAGSFVERAHLLSTVISNIQMVPDYYQKTTLTFRLCKYLAFKPYEDYLNGREDPPTKRARLSL
ncbi:m7GpppX diphosphatase [Chelonus insularis]|uniref:m7GpppX diphosphatase n=1 Tax=Chelonus insularis TaxID=460826 RepID=UPI00158E7F0C|nr:m7GpppX diphosphatase [Chelonus insularis]